ncbi:MAG: dicarboxylate/amino acid:cation symporter [Intestinibacter sp.]|uniref:dicarboxylate/amino acid:cation symporter n=1 Tax=Intestinibacter sp. TaxID=1965304 RepID=UPI0025C46689|nr:dicarboxylate/amino acid:cation symporter [Intestinibacter sp.]MCI6737526.1 dicarboxylate/amino acid:cation symporter [Intestinibacter sp.]
MASETSTNNSNQNVNTLARKMAIALIAGLVIGTALLFLRENLISNGHENIWKVINNLFFQDISTDEGKNAIGLFYIVGQLFINCLQLIIVPMIFSSIALAMCEISDTKKLGRISGKTLLGFLTTSTFALIVAIICGFITYKLGFFNVSISGASSTTEVATSPNPLMVILDAVPNNIGTVLITNGRVLSIVFLGVTVGLCINELGDKLLVFKKILTDINNIILVFLNFVIFKFGPVAVFVLITRTFAVYGIEHLKPAFAYLITVTIAATICLLVSYPGFIYFNTKLNPIKFMKKMAKVALLGVSAASSAAALSLNLKTTKEELGVSEDVASFVLPLGMTINMNGTAIMQVVGTVFIAASSGYEVTIPNLILIAILALIASVGTPSAPGSSMIVLFTVISGMGYNNPATLVAYALIIAINRPMDMYTTALNVIGDAATAVIVSKSENTLDVDVYNS